MELKLSYDFANVDWHAVADILKRVGMTHHAPEMHARAFQGSHTTVFAYYGGTLVGFGRAISDGVYQAALYDCAVLPEHQGKGIGAAIIKDIMARVGECNVILYASPGKEGFYGKFGFSRMKTGMARFIREEAMRKKGFTE